MPELREPTPIPEVDLEQRPYAVGEMTDDEALTAVMRTYDGYKSWRETHQEPRWKTCEELYFGIVPERKWPGSDVPRASLAVPIVYDQIEAAFPIIMDALFSNYPRFFEVTGPDLAACRRVEDVLAEAFDSPMDEYGMKAESHFSLAVRQMLLYGDGVVEVTWDDKLERPVVEWVDIRDVYFDPKTYYPLLDYSPAVIREKYIPVSELQALRGKEGIDIPPDEVLNALSKTSLPEKKGEQTFQPQKKVPIVDPVQQTVQVLQYWTKNRLIWVLGGRWVAINGENPYGIIPLCKVPYVVVPGNGYSMSLADVLEKDQKYAQGIRNARLDNLALALNPPRVRVAGAPVPPSARAWRPGLEESVQSPDQVEVIKIQDYTTTAFQEEQLIHMQASKRTGVNEFVQSGLPTPSNANRSASGVMQQVRMVSQRMSTAVKNFEDYLLTPVLYKMLHLYKLYAPNRLNLPPGEYVFNLRSASRMVVRERLAAYLGPITQILFSDVVAKQALQQGRILDFDEFARFLQDVTGTREAYRFFRTLTPQEYQQAQQPEPEDRVKLQAAQLSAQTRLAMGQMKAQTEQQKAAAKTGAEADKTAAKVLEILNRS